MPFRAQRAQWTESLVVMLARRKACLFPDMLVQAVVPIRTIPRPGEGLAFWHAPEIVFVEIFTLHALFAEAFEKVLADK